MKEIRLRMEKRRRIRGRLRGQRLGAGVELVLEQTADGMSFSARTDICKHGHLCSDGQLCKA